MESVSHELLHAQNQRCSKRNVRQAYHNVCHGCAKENKICAKCSCRVDHTVGRDITEVEAEQKALEEAIKNARERDRRSLLRAGDLLDLPAIAQLEKDTKYAPVHQLLKIVLTQRLDAYLAFHSSNPDLFKTYGFVHEDSTQAVQGLTIR